MTEEILPISALFFDDAGPHVVRAGYAPAAGSPQHTPARGSELRALLNTSITQLGAVSGEIGRRKTPVPQPPAVAIETLLFRGKAALQRALEIREEIIAGGTSPDRETIDELLDLVALASSD